MHLYQHLNLINKNSKNISICADDFGITKKVNTAIIKLAELNKISEISCIFVNNNNYDNKSINNITTKVDFGLHITLTDFAPNTNSSTLLNNENKLISLKELYFKTLFNKSDIFNDLRKEINSQFDLFCETMGFLPKFIDGHQHVHQFPLVNYIIFELIKKKYKNYHFRPWVRSCYDSTNNILSRKFIFKSLILKYFSKDLKKLSIENNIKTNIGFSGIYNFVIKKNFEEIFINFLNKTKNGHLIMVHPGITDNELKKLDSVTFTRNLEYEFLKSDSFDHLIKRLNINIVKQSNYLNLTTN